MAKVINRMIPPRVRFQSILLFVISSQAISNTIMLKKTQRTQGHLTHELLSVRNKSAFHHYPVPSPPKCAIKTSGKTQKQGEWFIVLRCCLTLKISALRNKATKIAVYQMYMLYLFDWWGESSKKPGYFAVRLTVRVGSAPLALTLSKCDFDPFFH